MIAAAVLEVTAVSGCRWSGLLCRALVSSQCGSYQPPTRQITTRLHSTFLPACSKTQHRFCHSFDRLAQNCANNAFLTGTAAPGWLCPPGRKSIFDAAQGSLSSCDQKPSLCVRDRAVTKGFTNSQIFLRQKSSKVCASSSDNPIKPGFNRVRVQKLAISWLSYSGGRSRSAFLS